MPNVLKLVNGLLLLTADGVLMEIGLNAVDRVEVVSVFLNENAINQYLNIRVAIV